MNKVKQILFLLLLVNAFLYSQPKRELRGVWVASLGIDWPSTVGSSSANIQSQKNELISLLDSYKSYGINAVFLHVRPMCDAVYKSSIEPWSRFLTGGTGGIAPADPNYDPLTFAISEAHKRGMELHAWLNPYRAVQTSGSTSGLPANHPVVKHPNWIIKCATTEYRFLNPGLPEVRNYLTGIITDITRRYDIDGIHFDDYFYPYTEYGTYNDDAAYTAHKYKYGTTERQAWRMNNVNLLLKTLQDSIKALKPHVKLTISPSGNQGVNQYVNCDIPAWFQGKYRDTLGVDHLPNVPYIDALIPQLDYTYNTFLTSMANFRNNQMLRSRHLYIGMMPHSTGQNADFIKEMDYNRIASPILGNIFFSSKNLISNTYAIRDTLVKKYYKYPALIPQMIWAGRDTVKPNTPGGNLRYEKLSNNTPIYVLKWNKATTASDGDSAYRYVVYASSNNSFSSTDLNNPAYISTVVGQNYAVLPTLSSAPGTYYYTVSSLDRNNNESPITTVIQVSAPINPTLVSPNNNNQFARDTVILKWNSSLNSSYYMLQVSTDSTFASSIVNLTNLSDTTYVFTSGVGQVSYFWRVKAGGPVGISNYSSVFKFKIATPLIPKLLSPTHGTTGMLSSVKFIWSNTPYATQYKIQISKTNVFNSSYIIKDTVITTDTTYTAYALISNQFYFWRVVAINQYGQGLWQTSPFGLKTPIEKTGSIPTDFSLLQNYPNPFNPTTVINFNLKEHAPTTLRIYNMLGELVAELINGEMSAGSYKYEFNASNLSSGIYIYKLTSGENVSAKKMTLIK